MRKGWRGDPAERAAELGGPGALDHPPHGVTAQRGPNVRLDVTETEHQGMWSPCRGLSGDGHARVRTEAELRALVATSEPGGGDEGEAGGRRGEDPHVGHGRRRCDYCSEHL